MSIDAMKQALEALDDVLQLSAEYSEVRAALRAAIEHAERPHTHSEECWRWHHQCAVAKIERMLVQQIPTCNKDPLVCWRVVCRLNGKCENTIQQRQLQGLTDKELEELSHADIGSYDLSIEVEAKLKEKNT